MKRGNMNRNKKADMLAVKQNISTKIEISNNFYSYYTLQIFECKERMIWMGTNEKRYFWLKLKEDFFDDKQIKYLRSLPDGDKVLITYLKMQLKSLKTAGTIRYDRILPSSEDELALMLD